MLTIYGTINDLVKFVKQRNYPKCGVLLRSAKTELPLAAYAYDGWFGGVVISRRAARLGAKPSHAYNDSDKAYRILKKSVDGGLYLV
ncbi:hypothetical protein UFOVP244_127 [uncultured Caudovirales phage]|uniref:Uncharacterized protein n=1 Tax=uncultured Caudovirales phage TaxID=2100421 RepID=A0A6J7WT72_9CAUD|nr:hypothetical protein UFOVP244_127 [uncultured Caudovirales phage]